MTGLFTRHPLPWVHEIEDAGFIGSILRIIDRDGQRVCSAQTFVRGDGAEQLADLIIRAAERESENLCECGGVPSGRKGDKLWRQKLCDACLKKSDERKDAQ